MAALATLFVAQPLVPSEAAAHQGHGALLVFLWFLLALAWAVGRLRLDPRPIRFGLVDAAVLLLVAWHTLSALVAFKTGSPRPALNMLWEWAALGVAFFLARQMVDRAATARALVGAMLSIGVAISVIGYWQFLYERPRDLVLYEQIKDNPQEMIELTGNWYPPGSSERENFENRLRSSEPFATFSLTNSLAGFLAPWLVMLVGVGVFGRRILFQPVSQQPIWRRRLFFVGVLTAATLIAGCLILTKSRSAFLATLGGLAALWPVCRAYGEREEKQPDDESPLRDERHTHKRRFKWIAAFGGSLAMLVLAATLAGGLDRQVVTEAGKSLGYRLQYWQSTWAMIRDAPLLGCGPGQFGDAYTAHKLPEASEEIQDPHNFLLEIWATAGAPAMLAFSIFVALLVWRGLVRAADMHANNTLANDSPNPAVHPRRPEKKRPSSKKQTRREGTAPDSAKIQKRQDPAADEDRAAALSVAIGAAVGVLLGVAARILAGFPFAPSNLAILAGALALMFYVLWPWILHGQLPRRLPALAVIVLLVNLLAAGGIGYSGVAGSLWLLAAISLSTQQSANHRAPVGNVKWVSTKTPRQKTTAWLGVAGAAVLFALCHQTYYEPLMSCPAELRKAGRLGGGLQPTVSAANLQAVEAAVAADPYSRLAAEQLAGRRFTQWLQTPSDETLAHFRSADQRMLELAPKSHAAWRTSARWQAAVFERDFERTGKTDEAQAAIDKYRASLQRYPTNAHTRAELAMLLAKRKNAEQAAVEAEAALRQDDITRDAGHIEKTLSQETRQRLEDLTRNSGPPPSADQSPPN